MPETIINVVPSFPWTRALPFNSQSQTPQSYMLPSKTLPKEAMQTGFTDQTGGLWAAGHEGMFTAERLMILPYCEGPSGSRFWTRLYGLSPAGKGVQTVWMPLLLAQFLCVTGDLSGPEAQFGDNLALAPTENLCNIMWPLNGRLGPKGAVVNPGPGFAAYALVELLGHEYFRFDFQCPETNPVGMNAFWRRA